MSAISVKRKQAVVLAGDIALLYLALALMVLIRYGVELAVLMFQTHLLPMTTIFILWIVLWYAHGLYDIFFFKPLLGLFRRFMAAWIIAVISATTIFYLVPFFSITPKTNLFIISIIYAFLFLGWRWSITFLYSAGSHLKTLLIYPHEELTELAQTIQQKPHLGYQITGLIPRTENSYNNPQQIPIFDRNTPLRALIAKHNIDLVVVGTDPKIKNSSEILRELYELLFWDVRIIEAEIFFESFANRVALADVNDAWFLKNVQSGYRIFYELAHALVDYTLAVIGGILLIIITPLMFLLTTITSPGPLFYRQQRVGKNGKIFSVIKFRTMHALTKDGGAELAGAQITAAGDPRVTRFGKIIRRLRIDELPQTINVLSGKMSFVGPRPERPIFVSDFETRMPFYMIRHLVKPGITGWAQINYSYAETIAEHTRKFEYDLYYLKHRSIILDLMVILKTIRVIFTGSGR